MSEIRVTFGGWHYDFQPGTTVTIGRGAANDIVVDDPTVSRQHAQLTWNGTAWVLTDVGRGRTFIAGNPVTGVALTQPTEIRLASPQGPTLAVGPLIVVAAAAPATVPPQQAAAQPQHGVVPPPPPPMGPGAPVVAAMAGGGAIMPGAGVHGGNGLRAEEAEIATALHILVPVRSWLKNPGWRQGFRLLVVAYALLPVIFLALFDGSGNLTTPGWSYSLYVAPLWAIAFWFLIRPGRISWQVIAGCVGIAVWDLVWMQLITITINDHIGGSGALSFPDALVVGFNEETTKAIPVLVLALLVLKAWKTKWDVRMWMWLGTFSGLVFGVREASNYTAQAIVNIAGATQSQSPAVQAVGNTLSFAERVFVDGFQHAIWAGIAGFFIGIAINYPRRRIQLILFGITVPALLHATNDWILGASTSLWPWIGVQAFSVLLFLGYTMSAHSIERRVRRSPVFRGQSILAESFSDSSELSGGT